MILTLVSDLIQQGFCRCCRAPAPPGLKLSSSYGRVCDHAKPEDELNNEEGNECYNDRIRSKNERNNEGASGVAKGRAKIKFSTVEIRAQETAKGGVKYEAILADPAVQTPPRRTISPSRASKQAVPLEEKLKAATERRMSLEANKMAQLAAKMEKIELAAKKREEDASSFVTQTKEALDHRMESHIENREAYITSLKAKVKDHLEKGEKTRLSLEQQANEAFQAVEESLKKHTEQRDENLKKMLERLHERGEQVRKVMNHRQEKLHSLEVQIQSKLDQASERREKMQQEEKEKLRTHNTTKLAEVRQTVESVVKEAAEEKNKAVQNKLITAEQNREKEMQKKLENIRKHERHAEVVRQNKEKLASPQQETASSG